MSMSSRAIREKVVYRQDTAPAVTSALWIDTSGNQKTLKLYDEAAGEWSATTQSPPLFGAGTDGDITRSSNTTENRLLLPKNYTIEGGVTVSVDTILCVFASESITVEADAIIDATGEGAAGGAGGAGGGTSSFGGDGDPGGTGVFRPHQAGGSGGVETRSGGLGGDGGDGDTGSPLETRILEAFPETRIEQVARNVPAAGAGGGGGGGSGQPYSDNYSGPTNGSFPGGGGGGGATGAANSNPGLDGGDGGDGGGFILLSAPTVQINGTVRAAGGDAAPPESGGGIEGGGGGGGSGGIILLEATNLSGETNTNVSGGSGSTSSDAADGADGADGAVIVL